MLRRYLVLLGVPGAMSFTLKGFRAGKASHLAASGVALPAIMEAGEWRSNAVGRYLDESAIDAKRVLDILNDDSGEDETP